MKKIITILSILIILLSNVTCANEPDFSTASSWAKEELASASSNGLIQRDYEDYQSYITREQFAEIIMNMYKEMTGNYPVITSDINYLDTNNAYVLLASEVGIISGKGEGLFAPNDKITRQEMAVMLNRTLDSIGVDYYRGDGVLTIADKANVSSWAVTGVDFAFENEFIRGDGIYFKPLDNTPIEQAIVITNRIYEKYTSLEKSKVIEYNIKDLKVGDKVGNATVESVDYQFNIKSDIGLSFEEKIVEGYIAYSYNTESHYFIPNEPILDTPIKVDLSNDYSYAISGESIYIHSDLIGINETQFFKAYGESESYNRKIDAIIVIEGFYNMVQYHSDAGYSVVDLVSIEFLETGDYKEFLDAQ